MKILQCLHSDPAGYDAGHHREMIVMLQIHRVRIGGRGDACVAPTVGEVPVLRHTALRSEYPREIPPDLGKSRDSGGS